MIRALALAVFLLPMSKAHSSDELFHFGGMPPYYEQERNELDAVPVLGPPPAHCLYRFSWASSTVTVKNIQSKHKSNCTFSHKERIQIPSHSTHYWQAIFVQHYVCTDGTMASYMTDWLGSSRAFRHQVGPDSLRCKSL